MVPVNVAGRLCFNFGKYLLLFRTLSRIVNDFRAYLVLENISTRSLALS